MVKLPEITNEDIYFTIASKKQFADSRLQLLEM